MKKLKAGSLQLVTFIVVVIALLLSAFILLIHIHKQFRIKTNHTIETATLVNKGILYALQNNSPQMDTISIPLNDEDYKSVSSYQDYWGIYKKIYSKAKIKHTILEKIALVGGINEANEETALYLKDNNKPLLLVGHTTINGKAYIPKRGVKSGYISGMSYYNDKFIYGSTAISKTFPKIDKSLSTHLKNLNNGKVFDLGNFEYLDINTSKHHNNSFRNPLQLIYNSSDIKISNVSISGHVCIQSKNKITVEANTKLKDVILVAPIIEIKDQVQGTFQSIATERIDIGKYVKLNYPSAVVLSHDYLKNESDSGFGISIADNSVIKGNVLALGANLPSNYGAQIKVNPNAIVYGVVYCEQNLELRGTIYGKVYTENFIIKEAGSIYQNHLFNAKINSAILEPEFVGMSLEQSKQGIVKWLY